MKKFLRKLLERMLRWGIVWSSGLLHTRDLMMNYFLMGWVGIIFLTMSLIIYMTGTVY